MQKLRFKRFDKPQFLKRIRRELLERFFARFQSPQSHDKHIPLPATNTPASEFFTAVAGLLLRPEQFSRDLYDALFAIEEMSMPEGLLRLERTAEWRALAEKLLPDSTPEDVAMQVWLAAPAVLARAHNGLRMRRLTAFEHAAHEGTGFSVQSSVFSPDNSPDGRQEPGFASGNGQPSSGAAPVLCKATLMELTVALDGWFARNQRGAESTRIEVYPMEEDYWFLIRHGDVFNRVARVERQETEILHFRPERDDVVVYAPGLDELRVNARTKRERDLYIEQFGLHLRGTANYFSQRQPYTLEPLRRLGRDALDPEGLEGIRKIKLCEIEIARNNHQREIITRQAVDLFECEAMHPGESGPIPRDGWLARAIFEVQLTGLARPQPVEIRLPNMLKLGRRCDPRIIQNFLCLRGFRNGRPGVSLTGAAK